MNDTEQKPQRVVVIGSKGFVGRHVCNALGKAQITFIGLSRNEVDLYNENASTHLRDLLLEGDVVIACAAKAPARNIQDLQSNLLLAQSIFDAVKEINVTHFVNISSDAVYCDEPLPLNESSPTSPSSFHGLMHLSREVLFSNLSCPKVNIRPTLIYGADDPHNGYGPNSFLRLAQKNQQISLFGNGEERRDHIFVKDVANLVLKVILYKSVGNINAVTGTALSFREIASLILEKTKSISNSQGTIRTNPMPHNGLRTFDNSEIFRAFPHFKMASFYDRVEEFVSDTTSEI